MEGKVEEAGGKCTENDWWVIDWWVNVIEGIGHKFRRRVRHETASNCIKIVKIVYLSISNNKSSQYKPFFLNT